jgi:DUF4097 and DUF4098 domain-containing protein YvlB
MQARPPRPPRSIAGAVVLILIGLVCLMGTMGIMNGRDLGLWFAKYWPALLILWGVIKLIEHEQAKRAGIQGRGIGVGGAFLMVFLIFAGLIATGVSRVDWGSFRDRLQIDDNDLNDIFGGSSFDYNDELTQAIPKASTLRVNNERGSVTVNVGDGETIRVSIRKKIHAGRQEDADNYNTKTKPQITVADKVVTLNASTQGAGDKGVSTDLDIFVPRDTALSISSRRGDITINGMAANVDIGFHQSGEVDISDLTGNASLNLEQSAARLTHVKGDVTIQGRAKAVEVQDVDGAVHLNGEFMETVQLVRVSKTVSFHSSRTDMEFARLDGRLDLDSGDLRADSLYGPMRLTTRSKDITLEGLTGDLRLEDSNGSVSVGLNKPGNIQIDNRKGDVQIAIPPNTPVKLEARTREGEIESDFEEFKVEAQQRQSSASGSIGANGPRIAINCEKGTVEIRRGSVTVAAPAAPAPPATPATPGKAPKALPAPKAKPVESEN